MAETNPWEDFKPKSEPGPWEDFSKKKEQSGPSSKTSGAESSQSESSSDIPTVTLDQKIAEQSLIKGSDLVNKINALNAGKLPAINIPPGGIEQFKLDNERVRAEQNLPNFEAKKEQIRQIINNDASNPSTDFYGDTQKDEAKATETAANVHFAINPPTALTGEQDNLTPEQKNALSDYAQKYLQEKPVFDKYLPVLDKDPKNIDALMAVGDASNRIGDRDQAMSAYIAADAIKPSSKSAARIANVFQQQGNLEGAKENLDKALKLNPEDDGSWKNKALVEMGLGNKDEADNTISFLKKAFPRDEDVYRISYYNNLKNNNDSGAKLDKMGYTLNWFANRGNLPDAATIGDTEPKRLAPYQEAMAAIPDMLEAPQQFALDAEAGSIMGVKEGINKFIEGAKEFDNMGSGVGSFLKTINGAATAGFSGSMLMAPMTNIAFHALPEEANRMIMQPIDALLSVDEEDRKNMSTTSKEFLDAANAVASIILLGSVHGVVNSEKVSDVLKSDSKLEKYKEILNNVTLSDVQKADEIWKTIPPGIGDIQTKLDLVPLIAERNKLSEESKNSPKILRAVYDQKIADVDSKIAKVAGIPAPENAGTNKTSSDASKIQSTAQVGKQPSGQESAGGQGSEGVGQGLQGTESTGKSPEEKVIPEGGSSVVSEVPPPGKGVFSKAVNKIGEVVKSYKEKLGIKTSSGEKIHKLDQEKSKRIADAYEEMKNDPNNPEVKKAYEAMAKETIDQYNELKNSGVKFEIYEGEGEPYKNSQEMLKDLESGHLFVLSTEKEFGSGITDKQRSENPLLADSGIKDENGKPMLINDVFRGVHDAIGHGERGNSFGAIGEENAWDVHSRMYSPLARRAMTTETRGQNSWVNFGKHLRNEDGSVKKLSPKEKPFAEQKIGLLPEWASKLPEESSPRDVLDQFEKGQTIETKSIITGTDDLSKKLSEKFPKISVYGGRASEGAALYKDGEIRINKNSKHWDEPGSSLEEAVMHEFVHDQIDSSPNKAEIEDLLSDIKNEIAKDSGDKPDILKYVESEGNSPQEVMTYGLTNKEVGDYISKNKNISHLFDRAKELLSSDKSIEGEPVKVAGAPDGTVLNVGMLIGKSNKLNSEQDIVSKLPSDVKVEKSSKVEGTEPTLSLKISRPLTPEEMSRFLNDTGQMAIPQLSDGVGKMWGSKEWGEFNPEYFILDDGTKLSDVGAKKEPIAPKPGDSVDLDPQIKGGSPRKMVFDDGQWKEKVGNSLTEISKGLQEKAQNKFDEQSKEKPEQAPEENKKEAPPKTTEPSGESSGAGPASEKKTEEKPEAPEDKRSESEKLRDEFKKKKKAENEAKMADAIKKSQEALVFTGIKIETDPEKVDKAIRDGDGQKIGDAVFIAKDGTIYIDPKKAAGQWGETIVWHESTHPIVNIIRNTNPELYDKIKSAVNKLDHPAMNEIRAWVEKNYKGNGKREDEIIVEAIAAVADGRINIDDMPRSTRQAIIDFVNKVAKYIGLDQVLSDTDMEAFKKLASQVSDSLKTGKDISEIVGKENVKSYENKIAERESQFVTERLFSKKNDEITKLLEESGKKPGKPWLIKDVAKVIQKWSKDNRVFKKSSEKLTDKQVIDGVKEETRKELGAWSEAHGEKYVSFYKNDIIDRLNPKLQEFAEKRYGRKLTPEEISLYHIVSGFASPQATPEFDSAKGLEVFDRYIMSKDKVLSALTDKHAKEYVKGEWTGKYKYDKEGNPVMSQVSMHYAKSSLDRINHVIKHFGGDLKKAINWLETPHPYEEVSEVMGAPLKGPNRLKTHENFTVENGGFGIFGTSGAKLGSYILNRIGQYSTITKDMWYARTMARFFGEPLIEGGKVLSDPWAQTKEGVRMRKLADQAWSELGKEMGLDPSDIQERMWDYEKRLYEKLGSKESASYASDGFMKKAKELESSMDFAQASAERTGDLVKDTYYEPHLTETKDKSGYVFYHVSNAAKALIKKGIDSTKFFSTRTSKEEKGLQYGKGSFYTKASDGENMVGGDKYSVAVPKDKVYPMDTDPNGYRVNAEKEIPEGAPYREEKIKKSMSEQAAKDGYQMAVAEWNYSRTGKQGELPAMRADALTTLKPKEFTGEEGRPTGVDIPHPDQERLQQKEKLTSLAEDMYLEKPNKLSEEVRIFGGINDGGEVRPPTPREFREMTKGLKGELSDRAKQIYSELKSESQFSAERPNDTLIDAAKAFMKEGGKSIEEFAKFMDEPIDDLRSAWATANKEKFPPRDFTVKDSAPENTVEDLNNKVQRTFDSKVASGMPPEQAYEIAVAEAKSDSLYENVVNDTRFEEAMWKKFFGNRRFTERFEAQYDNPSLTNNARFYPKISLIQTLEDARAAVSHMGEENALITVLNKNAPIPYTSRIAMGEVMIDGFNKQIESAKAGGDSELVNTLYDKQAGLVEAIAEIGTTLAQGLNVFKLWQKLSPEAQSRRFSQDYERIRDGGGKTAKKKAARIVEKAKAINAAAISEAISDPAVQNIINKSPNKSAVKTSKRYGDENKIVSRDRYNELKARISKLGMLGSLPVRPEVIELGMFHVEALIRSGAHKFSDFADAMERDLGKKVRTLLKDIYLRAKEKMIAEGFREKDFVPVEDINKELESKAISKTNKIRPDLRKLIDRNFVGEGYERQRFIDEVLKTTGLSAEDATRLVDILGQKFDGIVAKKKSKILERMLTKKERSRIPKQDWEKIVEWTNLGGFDDAKVAKVLAEKIGIPELTPEQRAEHADLARKIGTAKAEFDKYRAIEDMLKYESHLNGINYGELATSVWYANVLSGYKTHILNLGANSVNTVFRLLVSMRNPTDIPYMLKGALEGAGRGVYEALDVLKTGYSPIKGKAEMPSALEMLQGSDSPLRFLNALKYVERSLKAADVLSYSINKEMRAYQLAKREAVNAGFDKISKDTFKVVGDKLFNTKEQLDVARQQAKDEGYKGLDFKRRVWEIMESQRDANDVRDAKNFAARATWNYDPEGTMGVLVNAFNAASNAIKIGGIAPLKFFVPFTRVVANVANDYIEYFPPAGIMRAAKGGIGFKGFETAKGLSGVVGHGKYREYTPEERWDALTKATIGTAAMGFFLYASQPDDKGKSMVEITGNGAGDWQKNAQLQEGGWHPYSIRIGKTWYSYINTPLAVALTPVGYYRDKIRYQDSKPDDKNLLNEVAALTWVGAKYFTDMTFLKSATDLTNAVSSQDPNVVAQFFEKSLPKIAKGFVIPNMYTQAAQDVEKIMGSYSKDSKGLKAQFLRNIPVARNTLNDKINVIGDPVNDDTDRFFSGVKHDDFWDFIIDNNAFIPKFNKKAESNWILDGEVKRMMTDDEEYNFNKVAGAEMKQRILDLKNGTGEDYDNMTDDEGNQITSPTKKDVQDAVTRIVNSARKNTKKELFQPQE